MLEGNAANSRAGGLAVNNDTKTIFCKARLKRDA
jgi:hypothetical protein